MKEVMVVLEVGVVVVVVLMLVEGLMVMVEMGRKYLKNGGETGGETWVSVNLY